MVRRGPETPEGRRELGWDHRATQFFTPHALLNVAFEGSVTCAWAERLQEDLTLYRPLGWGWGDTWGQAAGWL